ncbi:uncharacterized protein FOMMEDRAFT_159367 [Fomitiporia mediterranea MF3/22]|uniref:uncharacterized protein n=1 Tax=Fomitiporia mediterranea (strain MF3/22) TaxID=694068 RepID=UPI0004407846|nr:uncharacterized protein FOMMEDRAFT_159367 [Fomitiporia mediterranea MF3/22]EJD00609.1 hypothetical protein FOMMEDRAFT_159367 [Fomitiporia mediterranea MF3/22]
MIARLDSITAAESEHASTEHTKHRQRSPRLIRSQSTGKSSQSIGLQNEYPSIPSIRLPWPERGAQTICIPNPRRKMIARLDSTTAAKSEHVPSEQRQRFPRAIRSLKKTMRSSRKCSCAQRISIYPSIHLSSMAQAWCTNHMQILASKNPVLFVHQIDEKRKSTQGA